MVAAPSWDMLRERQTCMIWRWLHHRDVFPDEWTCIWHNETMFTTWSTDWDNYSTANCFVITLNPTPCCIHKTSITIFCIESSTLYTLDTTTLAYSKWPYICLKATMCIIHGIILFLPESSTIFHYGTWSCDSMICDIPLTHNPSPKNRITVKKRGEK